MSSGGFNQGVMPRENEEKAFEISLTTDQFKLLQKILPTGYSLKVADKNTRTNSKKSRAL